MGTYLDGILAWHRRRASEDSRELSLLVEEALASAGTHPPRGFLDAFLPPRDGLATPALVAEVKRRSPSRGDLAPDARPAELAAAYERGGASAVSVLTDAPHFGGSPDDLVAARNAVGCPVLRKDFTVSPADVCDARLFGADAVLLIVAGLSDGELRQLLELADALSLAALVEVHDETEIARAMAAGARLLGVNQRDLRTFHVDTERAARLAGSIPVGVAKIAESGIRTHDDARRLGDAGYDGMLVGESLVTSSDPEAAVRRLLTGSAVPCG
jgi:indole-3-glycerol phosphate synthase